MADVNGVEEHRRGISNTEMKRILIFRGGAIGDFVLTTPALSALRQHWPESYIELVTYPRVSELAVVTGLADRCRSLEDADVARMFSRDAAGSVEWRKFISSFDTVISYLHDQEGNVRTSVQAAGAQHLLCADPIVMTGHAVDHFLRPLAELGIPFKPHAIPRLILPEARLRAGHEHARRYGSTIITIHPGSGSVSKNWPPTKFCELAERLRTETALSPVFTLGEADDAVADILAGQAHAFDTVSSCDLVAIAALLANSGGYVGNDSGITHLAAAVGIPVIALYGPTRSATWAPRGAHVNVLCATEPTTESLAEVTVQSVLDQLWKSL